MVELAIHGIAKGGDGLGREASGRVVFVRGAVPGDVVEVEIVEQKKRFARASIVRVIKGGVGRIEPVCSHVGQQCGGCDFQHAQLDRQRELKRTIVTDAFERIGHFANPQVSFVGGVAGHRYRTTVRCAVVDGKAGFRQHHSDRRVATPQCTIAHPVVRELMASSTFGSANEVLIRVGSRTGDANVVVWPDAADTQVEGAQVLGGEALKRGEPLFVHEEIAGRRWRVSAQSFTQSSPEAAELLVGEVARQLEGADASGALCDLYSGIGLFAGSLGHEGPVLAVEGNPFAVEDARTNLSDLDVAIETASIDNWQPKPADIVVADPPRAGLGVSGAAAAIGTGATTVVLVSCDPAAGARDARLLVDAGFHLDEVSMLDLFPQTSHIELVCRFGRDGT